jgi:hypothetical protein
MSTSSFDSDDDEDIHMLRDALRQMQALPPSSLDLAPGWNLQAAIRANVHDDDFFYDSSSETPYLRELPVPWAEDGYFSSQELEMESPIEEYTGGFGLGGQNCEMDVTITVNGTPLYWGRFQDYYVWACRGTISEITEQAQAAFRFNPPVSERFIGTLLNGINATRHIKFLETYLPGEKQTLQRAVSRMVLHEIDFYDADVYAGGQGLDVSQLDSSSANYPTPPLPPNAPNGWSRLDDAILLTFIDAGPENFRSEYGRLVYSDLDLEFLGIRMAQCIHLDISSLEVVAALTTRESLWQIM